jgi:uncharacterized protein YktB (UPF0637 family)
MKKRLEGIKSVIESKLAGLGESPSPYLKGQTPEQYFTQLQESF